MKTLLTLIACLFVVDAANAEDKWEYLQIEFRHNILSEEHMHSYYVEGKHNGIEYKAVWLDFFKPDGHKTTNFVVLDSYNEKHKRVFGKGIPQFKSLIQYLNFYGDFGFEIVSTVQKPKTTQKEFEGLAVFLKRKTN